MLRVNLGAADEGDSVACFEAVVLLLVAVVVDVALRFLVALLACLGMAVGLAAAPAPVVGLIFFLAHSLFSADRWSAAIRACRTA